MPFLLSDKRTHNEFMFRTISFMLLYISRLLAHTSLYICLICSTQKALADFSKADETKIQSIIEDFIIKNPEIIRDALMKLALTEQSKQQRAALALVTQDEGDPKIGPTDAAITIYEFSDYNCGYCKRVFAPLQQLLAEDDDVKLVLKEFPILSQTSMLAAQAAVAAQAQGVFPDFHVAMMTARGAVSMDSIMAAASEAGADLDRLQADMNGAEVAMIIERTRAAAQQLNISGTPGLVIGTQVIPGAIGIDEMRQIIAAMRAENG